MAEPRRLTQLVEGTGGRLRLPPGDLVVALSGGADSAALAYLALAANRNVRGLHIDHGFAGSPLMEKAASKIAADLNLGLDVARVEVPTGPSPEGQARKARYEAFADSVGPHESLLTGHTQDDDVETVLINLIRGTGSQGLAGIPYSRPPNIVRPMLKVTRSETREIAALAGLGFVDDPMNDAPGLTRNVLRLQILPGLRQLNPKLDDSVVRMAAAIGAESDHIASLADGVAIHTDDGFASAAISTIQTVPRSVANRVLLRILSAVGLEPTSDRVDRLWSVVRREAESQELGAGVKAAVYGPLLLVMTDIETQSELVPVRIEPGTTTVGGLEFDVIAHQGPCRVIPLSRWAAIFPRETVLEMEPEGVITADGEPAWIPGRKRLPVAWYEPGTIGYLSVFAREKTGWTSSH